MGLKESGLRGSLRNVSVGIDAIPDSEELYAHYDWSQEDGSMPIIDLSDNDNDLDSGGYSGVGGDINGVQAGEFVDDIVFNDDGIGESPDYNIFFVCTHKVTDDIQFYICNEDGNAQLFVDESGNSDDWAHQGDIFGGDASDSESPSIMGFGFESDGWIRQDGEEVAAGSLSPESYAESIYVGGDPRDGGRFFIDDGLLGELLIYPPRTDGQIDDVEEYLSDKWEILLD